MKGYMRVLATLALVAAVTLGVVFFAGCSRGLPGLRDHYISLQDAKALRAAKGDAFLTGFSGEELDAAVSIEDVIQRFGNPKLSEEQSGWTGRFKVLVYDSKDEFGNQTEANLFFIYAGRDRHDPNPPLQMWRLIKVNFGQDQSSQKSR